MIRKRPRCDSNSSIASVSTQKSSTSTKSSMSCISPYKRQKTCTDENPDANKENIPPEDTLSEIAGPPARSTRRVTAVTPRKSIIRRQLSRCESTPVIELGNLQLVTPPTTPAKPAPSAPTDIYTQARALLRTSSATSFTGRQAERTAITDFLTSEDKFCLYVSGTPGTGKTALVNDVLRGLDGKYKSKYLNCMGMNAEDIRASARDTRDEHADDECAMVMVLDELEHLDSATLSPVFAVGTPSFRIIGISNTHTLTSKPTTSTITLHFKPYTSNEMTQIIAKRLEELVLPDGMKAIVAPAALSFACRKVSSQTGDLRACLALVRGAIETAEKEFIKNTLANQGDSVAIVPVSMAHVLAATKTVSSQAPGTVGVVRQLNIQARLVLLSLLLSTRRLSASLPVLSKAAKTPLKSKAKSKAPEALTIDGLFEFYTHLLSSTEAVFSPVSRNEFADLVGLVETLGLLERGPTGGARGKGKAAEKSQSVGIPSTSREEEMVKGLTEPEDPQMEGPAEREIRTMWNRETARIKRETEEKEMVIKKRQDAFEDATEA